MIVSYCEFGAPYRNHNMIDDVYADYFENFRGRTCKGGHTHVALEVFLITHASKYPLGLCSEIADAILIAKLIVDALIRMGGCGDDRQEGSRT